MSDGVAMLKPSFQRTSWPGKSAKTRFALLPGHDELAGFAALQSKGLR
jgi:hypothetical protein